MQKKWVIIGVVAAVVAGAVWFTRGGNEQAGGAGAQGGAVEVTAVQVKREAISLTEQLPGRTSAYKVAEIRPQVSGIIIERSFTEGDVVQEGQQLYQIDPATYQATYDSARAELQRAQANAKSVRAREKRYEELVAIDAVSKQEYDDIKAQLAQVNADIAVAEASVKQAKINLDYTKVYSPISGRIGKSAVTEGALVTANQTQVLTKVTQLDPIYVDMTQSSTDLMRIRRQMGEQANEATVAIKLEGGERYEHEGKLQFSDVTVDESTGSVQLRALMPNPDRLLLPGLFVRAELKLGEQEVLLLPQQSAVRDAEGGLSVWVVGEDGTVNPRPISTMRAYESNWIVTDGVEMGEKVVLEGFQKIRPGAQVTAVAPQVAEQREEKQVVQAAEAADEAMEEGEPQPVAAAPAAPEAEEGEDVQQESAE